MAVTRDYKIDNIEPFDSFAFTEAKVNSASSSEPSSASNALLLGGVARTDTSSGKIATVNNGEKIEVAIENVKKAGGGTVILLPGTYKLESDLEIPDGVTLEGASRDGVLIDCNTSYKVVITGSDAYSTGTVTISLGDTTVVGSGTTWTADMVGQYILLGDFYYEITARNSNTSIDISEAYAGENLSGDTYVIATVNFNATLRKVTVFNATGSGVKVQYAFEPNIDDVIVYECGTGIDIDDTVYPKIYTTSSNNGVNLAMDRVFGFKIDFSGFDFSTSSHGVILSSCANATFFDSSVSGNTADGIVLSNCTNIVFISIAITGNGDDGVSFSSTSTDNQFFGINCERNTGDGFTIAVGCSRNTIAASSIKNNGAYGINISLATGTTVVAPVFDNNTLDNINDNGTDTVILPDPALAARSFDVFEAINGAGTPQPVRVTTDGSIIRSEADVTLRQGFFGFVKTAHSNITPDIIGTPLYTTSTTQSYTVEPGNDLVLFVVSINASNTNFSIPTGFTWDGNAMTSQGDSGDTGGSGVRVAVWTYALGDVSSNTTANVVRSGGSGANYQAYYIFVYDKTKQTAPILNEIAGSFSTGGTSTSVGLTPTQIIGRTVVVGGSRVASANVTTSGVTDLSTDTNTELSEVENFGDVTAGVSSGSNSVAVIGFTLNGVVNTQAKVYYSGVISGFSGLTPGSTYYISDTIGTLSTTPGTVTIEVGTAISTTEILLD